MTIYLAVLLTEQLACHTLIWLDIVLQQSEIWHH